jgi:hypothetical protein
MSAEPPEVNSSGGFFIVWKGGTGNEKAKYSFHIFNEPPRSKLRGIHKCYCYLFSVISAEAGTQCLFSGFPLSWE